jgi:hypothetical protein
LRHLVVALRPVDADRAVGRGAVADADGRGDRVGLVGQLAALQRRAVRGAVEDRDRHRQIADLGHIGVGAHHAVGGPPLVDAGHLAVVGEGDRDGRRSGGAGWQLTGDGSVRRDAESGHGQQADRDEPGDDPTGAAGSGAQTGRGGAGHGRA